MRSTSMPAGGCPSPGCCASSRLMAGSARSTWRRGKTIWDRAFGEARTNGPFGIPSMLPITIGTPNNGGAVVTASGLVFIAAATDNLIRAIDLNTGKTVWKDVLPGGGQATPMTYEHERQAVSRALCRRAPFHGDAGERRSGRLCAAVLRSGVRTRLQAYGREVCRRGRASCEPKGHTRVTLPSMFQRGVAMRKNLEGSALRDWYSGRDRHCQRARAEARASISAGEILHYNRFVRPQGAPSHSR